MTSIENIAQELFSTIETDRLQLKPSDWAEKNIVLTSAVSTVAGKFRYNITPYLREIVNHMDPYSDAKIIGVIKGSQIGFALWVGTKIPTPSGYEEMYKLKIGDELFDEKGNICKVTFATDVMFNHNCYEIEFSDHTKIITDENHLWKVWDEKKYEYKKEKIIDTLEISKTFKTGKKKVRNRYAIENTKPLQLPNKDLLIHPYILGYWLGDGDRTSNRITCDKLEIDEISNLFRSLGEPCIKSFDQKGRTATIVMKRKDSRFNIRSGKVDYIRFGERLTKLGILRNKHIPKEYMRSSYNQRLNLLQGLMDSDGHITKKGRCSFYNIDVGLVFQIKELLNSLGIKSTTRIKHNGPCKIHQNKIYNTKPIYEIGFTIYHDKPCFKMSRKKDRILKREGNRVSETERRRIINVKKIDSLPVKCITVDSESHLYLAGEQMIPTHNTQGVVVPGLTWMIANNPGNCIVLSADDELSKELVEGRIDPAIQSAGIQHLIGPNTIRKRNQRTGDTSRSKEFAGGRIYFGGVNAITKYSRQRSIKFGFFDDWEKAPVSDKTQGNTFDIIQQRFATASKSMKQFYISTPETKPSNIEIVYLKGDQRKWHVPCPKCGEFIEIIWHKKIEGNPVGVYFEKDDNDRLIEKSVGYICQKCGEFFKEKHKYEMNLSGIWVPTAEPSQYGFYSYHISNLVAAPHMYGWTHYARVWLSIYEGGITRKQKLKAFVNQTLGYPWEERTNKIDAMKLRNNTRDYDIGTVPNSLSKKDGNGNIVLLTLACDLNGTIDDARLDYDIWGHSENGSIYSVDQGSIGTYYPGIKDEHRDLWSYRHESPNNVWNFLWNELISKHYYTDEGKKMPFIFSGVDTGYMTQAANDFIDMHSGLIVGLKGSDPNLYSKMYADKALFKREKMRPLTNYILESNIIKDNLARMIGLTWTHGEPQPAGFMNFPRPEGTKYTGKYFDQFEAETKVLEENEDGDPTGWRWVKKSNSSQNHYFDTAYYNLILRDIFTQNFLQDVLKIKGTWADFVKFIKTMMEDD